nr:redoxin domain-containing protein [candidate division Zixibacteria bacterium]
MRKSFFIILAIIIVLPLGLRAEEKFKVGDAVPMFDLPYATKDTINMKGINTNDLKGRWYLLAFYPASWSPGCTKEMCIFRDEFADFRDLDIEILAISGDYVFTQYEWAKHNNFNFKLLADHTRKYGNKMGVYIDDYGMFQRSVFVVDPDGKFAYIDYEYSLENDKDYNALMQFLRSRAG